ncbi:MAG: HAMP domain-containing histidine kinase [Gemmataceae bacterium]|nr:HAMP domain-containing histidine kinase [Gemmataceae bacterium]
MRCEPLKAAVRSLRFRLMAWNVAVVLLMVIPTLVGVRAVLSHLLLQEFDELLREDGVEIGLALRQSPRQWDVLYQEMERKAQGHVHRGWFVQLFDAEGRIIWSSQNTPAEGLPTLASTRMATQQAEGYRMTQSQVQSPGTAPMTIRVGASMETVEEDITLLTRMLSLAAALILLLAPLGGYWLAGRATRPLKQIITTTAHLRPANLNERLPLRGTGDELDQLSQTINGLLDRIATYLARTRDFVADAAHELRSPLAAICTSVEVALAGHRKPEEYESLLSDTLEQVNGLRLLVSQLLLLTEGGAERMALQGRSARLDLVAKRTMEMFRGVAESQGIELRHPFLDAVLVPGDEHYLQQVVNNLVDNAIKFSPQGGRVSVEVRARPNEGQAVLRVADRGVGIPPQDLPLIFDRFFRGDKTRQREAGKSGNGLGLSICHSIVTSLQGTITADSRPGAGTEFTVRLPLVSAPPAQASPSA